MSQIERSGTLDAALQQAAAQLAQARPDGATAHRPVLYLPGNAGRIDAVEQWLFAQPEAIAGCDVFQIYALGPAEGWERTVLANVGLVTPFIGPGVRHLVNAGLARNIRCNLSQVPQLFEGRWRPEVAIAHVSPPDAEGRVTLGLNAGLDIAPVRAARWKLAVVSRRMPRWHIASVDDPASGQRFDIGCAMRLDEFDAVVEIDEPLLERPMQTAQSAEASADTRAIAANVIDLLHRDAAMGPGADTLPHTLQLGIGRLPDAVADELVARGLGVAGIWSEMLSDGVLRLLRAGLIARAGRTSAGERDTPGHIATLRERIVVGFVLGSMALYEAMHDNPAFAVLPQAEVNDPALIRLNDRMASLNAALAVSLTGEVAAATLDKRYYSDVGGQFDFALGASWSRGGVAVIGLPSAVRLRDGALGSRIVATHAEGAHHTIGADLPVVVVSEQGAADLRGLHDCERVEAMLSIAHPQWRAALAKDARTLPSMQGVGAIPAQLVALRDGRHAVLRPAVRADIPAIADYIGRLSEADRFTRYMGTVSERALTDPSRMNRLYDETLDYREHAAFLIELDREVIGVSHAFRIGQGGTYEVSYSRRSDFGRQGLGTHLMHALIDWGVAAGAENFYATTYRNKNPRMRSLFDRFGFSAHADPDDYNAVSYRATVHELARQRAVRAQATAALAESARAARAPGGVADQDSALAQGA
ncbi:acetyl-CoA hydrolase [Burkholderiales bacterium JOSHI_001]|nr:acetyl-CoA hydrolase [Burkholderiales bacterium JOSHI_001]